jgi:hypothetical protein
MDNRRRSRSRKGCRRNRRQLGGNTGQSYTLGEPLVAGNPGLGAVVLPFSSCGNAVAPGYLQGAQLRGGLPGFAGGRRSRKQQGGVYAAGAPLVTGPGSIAYLPRVYSGCGEGAYAVGSGVNTITAPPAMKGGAAMQLGTAPVGGMVYHVPNAGYSGVPSNASGGSTLADGRTPFLVNQPYSAQPMASPACLKTGGGSRKGSRKNRKNRKNRKGSRKNRN